MDGWWHGRDMTNVSLVDTDRVGRYMGWDDERTLYMI
jgi:hypothetical protein